MSELRERLTKFKDFITTEKRKMFYLIKTKNDMIMSHKEYTEKIKIDILNEMDEKGKVLYSNQAKRDAAFNDIIKDDSKDNSFHIELDDIENEIKEIELNIENTRYSFRIEEIISRLGE